MEKYFLQSLVFGGGCVIMTSNEVWRDLHEEN